MSNKTTTLILGYVFGLANLFGFYSTFLICSSIFFSAHFIIKTLEKLNKK